MIKGRAKVGDKVYIKGYESLEFEVMEIHKRKKRPVVLAHPGTGMPMSFDWKELREIEK